MASHSSEVPFQRQNRLGVVRIGVAASLASAAFFVLCWLGALLPIAAASHLYLRLFTIADPASPVALAQGVAWSAVFGLLAGALFALIYNRLGGLEKS